MTYCMKVEKHIIINRVSSPLWSQLEPEGEILSRDANYHTLLLVLIIVDSFCIGVVFVKTAKNLVQDVQDPLSPDPLSSSFVNFLYFLLHSLHPSNLQFSNRCKIGISLKCRWKFSVA
jgi:hypothetical protein